MKKNPIFQIIVYLGMTFTITAWFYYQFIFRGGLENNKDLIFYLMWTPGIVGLVCSLIFGHRFKDIGFHRFSIKGALIAYFVPAVAALLVFLLLIVSGIDTFGVREKFFERFGDLNGILFNTFVYTPTIGFFFGFVRAMGEEIGWRGFLHDKLIRAKVRAPFFLTGIIWSLWHLPLILFADYSTSDLPYVSASLFVIAAVAASIFCGWLREATGSVWVAGIGHVSHNMWIQTIYPRFIKKGPLDQYFGGESGVFLAVIYSCLALYIWRKLRKDKDMITWPF